MSLDRPERAGQSPFLIIELFLGSAEVIDLRQEPLRRHLALLQFVPCMGYFLADITLPGPRLGKLGVVGKERVRHRTNRQIRPLRNVDGDAVFPGYTIQEYQARPLAGPLCVHGHVVTPEPDHFDYLAYGVLVYRFCKHPRQSRGYELPRVLGLEPVPLDGYGTRYLGVVLAHVNGLIQLRQPVIVIWVILLQYSDCLKLVPSRYPGHLIGF